jgi:hypothetical protein
LTILFFLQHSTASALPLLEQLAQLLTLTIINSVSEKAVCLQLNASIVSRFGNNHVPKVITGFLSFCRSQAHWFRACFDVVDRGWVFRCLQRHLFAIDRMFSSPNTTLVQCRLECIHIVCGHEHYIALNLPHTPEAVEETVAPLGPALVQRHFLSGTVLQIVQSVLVLPANAPGFAFVLDLKKLFFVV